jgi:tRNA modification GTPase
MLDQEAICAITTAHGMGAIAVIRISGENVFKIADHLFRFNHPNKLLSKCKANTMHYGQIVSNDETIDDVIVSVFRMPHSFTGEDTIEISCHGSVYIQQRILQVLIQNGARMARPGEFTQRAFLNGKLDLSQAEAVADLIASSSGAAHKLAYQQMKGGISKEIKFLRDELLNFISLVELELDFSEEDVEFANRQQLISLVSNIEQIISKLVDSFKYGNAIKNGIPVAIVGETNVGKSTLLNALLNEERAIVSEIAGTTRDVIEDVIIIDGIQFRFIDTAGIRHTNDTIESMGIERTFAKIEQAEIVLALIDATRPLNDIVKFLTQMSEKLQNKKAILVINKKDKATTEELEILVDLGKQTGLPTVLISAKNKINISDLTSFLVESIQNNSISENDVVITNARHYEAFTLALQSIKRVNEGLKNKISGDFLAQDIREGLHYLGSITGDISTDEVLGNIFKNFCIGK